MSRYPADTEVPSTGDVALVSQKSYIVYSERGQGEMKVCPECHGQGRIEDEDGNIVTCPECHGSGVVGDHHDDDPGTIREPPG